MKTVVLKSQDYGSNSLSPMLAHTLKLQPADVSKTRTDRKTSEISVLLQSQPCKRTSFVNRWTCINGETMAHSEQFNKNLPKQEEGMDVYLYQAQS